MSYAKDLEDEIGGLEIDQLPPELREQARKEKHSQGGFRYDTPRHRQHIKAQRAAIWSWFRGLGGNLIKHGVNLTKVPLPVELCEPRSFLQRLTDSWSYLDLLHAAAAASDPAERLKLVMAFAVGGMRQQVSCDKPFNPILGETLQAVFPCGCRVYAEQVSHHPPVSCWQVVDPAGQFEYSGSSCWSATFTGNSVKGTQTGQSRVRFSSDGATVTWSLPTIHIRGVLFGDRVVKYHDTITFTDDKNGLSCELQIDPAAPKKGLVKRLINKARHPRHKHTHDQLLGDLMRGQQLLDSCSGSWLSELSWDKGVRSIIMPAAAPAAAVADAAADGGPADDDAASLGCHSIGSFSSTASSTASEGGGGHGEQQDQEPSSGEGSSGRRLTASALAAHSVDGGAGAAAGAAGSAPATLSSSEATGHRCGRGIAVVKSLWSAKTTPVMKLQPLADDDPQLLASDCRFRPDVMALGGGQPGAAQHWKLVLEQAQRRDRALREGGGRVAGHAHSDSAAELLGGAQDERALEKSRQQAVAALSGAALANGSSRH